ncbi:MAG: FHA domain-containing protein [Acidobacteriota bacterium]
MPETPKSLRTFSLDWLVQGVLTKVGDTFDRLTGRGWKPSSSLATSELIGRLKTLVDAEVRQNGDNRKFVPHNIKLKMQWDKFSTDSDEGLRKLEIELLSAVVDHINDKRYYTYAPISLQVKPDYFTSGVKLLVSFDKTDSDEGEAEIHVSVPGSSPALEHQSIPPEAVHTTLRFSFGIDGKDIEKVLSIKTGGRIGFGRTKENDLMIADDSVSKYHGSVMLDSESKLMISDTGSTNGILINGSRIPYGKAVVLRPEDSLTIGAVEVSFETLAAKVGTEVPESNDRVAEETGNTLAPEQNDRTEGAAGPEIDNDDRAEADTDLKLDNEVESIADTGTGSVVETDRPTSSKG